MVSRRCWFLFKHYFFEFPTKNPFYGKFGPKKSKLFVLPENWHTWYLEDAGSTLNPFLGKSRSKVPSHHFLLKLGTQSILKMLILIPILVFSISNLKFIFVQIWAENVKVFVLPGNWHTDYIEDTGSYCRISFLNFWP